MSSKFRGKTYICGGKIQGHSAASADAYPSLCPISMTAQSRSFFESSTNLNRRSGSLGPDVRSIVLYVLESPVPAAFARASFRLQSWKKNSFLVLSGWALRSSFSDFEKNRCDIWSICGISRICSISVSYTHLRAHETDSYLV